MIPALSRGHGDAVFHGPLMLQHVSPADALVAFVLGCLQGCLCSEQPWEIEAGPPAGAESWGGGLPVQYNKDNVPLLSGAKGRRMCLHTDTSLDSLSSGSSSVTQTYCICSMTWTLTVALTEFRGNR